MVTRSRTTSRHLRRLRRGAGRRRAANYRLGRPARDHPRSVRGAARSGSGDRVEAVSVRHYTSRAGDPHRHLHLQINARVSPKGHGEGCTRSRARLIDAINGIGHAAVMTDPGFRAALAPHGFTLDPTGEVASWPRSSVRSAPGGADRPPSRPLRGCVARRSARRSRARTAAGVGPAGLGRRPSGQGRPRTRRRTALRVGSPNCTPRATATAPAGAAGRPRLGHLDRDEAVRRGARAPRVRARRRGTPPTSAARSSSLLARTLPSPTPRCGRARRGPHRPHRRPVRSAARPPGVPEHVRALTSRHVLEVEADLVGRLALRVA